jgi:hypothetical protein
MRLGNLVESGARAIRAALPKSRNGGEDDAWINGTERFVGYSQAVFDVRPKILNHHVCVPDQSHENVVAGRFLQIERQRTLVAVKIQHVGTVTRAAHTFVGVDAGRRLES